MAALFAIAALSSAAQTQFHWQWQKMRDDFWQGPIIRQMKVSNDQRVAITDALVGSMRADKEFFGDIDDAQLWDLASNESYEWVDLDGDGIPELITGGFGVDQCGGTGNCILQIFRPRGAKLDLLLYSRAEKLMVDRSGPIPLLVLYTHSSAMDGNLEVYSFPKNQKAKLVHSYDVQWSDPVTGSAYKIPHLK